MPQLSKPFWDTSIEGQHPAFTNPIRVEELRTYPPAALTNEEKELVSAAESVVGNLANMINFAGDERSDICKERAITALIKLGRLDEAILLSDSDPYVVSIRDAIYKEDGLDCGCPRPTVDVPDSKGRDIQRDLNRRFPVLRLWSPLHNEMVTLWKCSICGDLNAHNIIPERQQKIHELIAAGKSVHDSELLR